MRILLLCAGFALSGCAILHHAQIGDIDQTGGKKLRPFDVKVSETGVSIDEAIAISKHFAGKNDAKNLGEIGTIIGYFQMGPSTGEHVYNDTYAQDLLAAIYKKCPSGQVTGLMAIRESRKYPVISGEIVKITGYCKG